MILSKVSTATRSGSKVITHRAESLPAELLAAVLAAGAGAEAVAGALVEVEGRALRDDFDTADLDWHRLLCLGRALAGACVY